MAKFDFKKAENFRQKWNGWYVLYVFKTDMFTTAVFHRYADS